MAPGVVSCDVSRGGIAAACKKLLVVETSEDRTSSLSSSRNPSILSMTFPADGSVWIGGFMLGGSISKYWSAAWILKFPWMFPLAVARAVNCNSGISLSADFPGVF